MPCTACHTEFPQLTPFGRFFKLTGYTLIGSDSKLPPLAVMASTASENNTLYLEAWLAL